MIISHPSKKYLSTPIPEEDEINETSHFLKSNSSHSLIQPPPKPIFTWTQIKDSVNEFLNSNTEIFNNVTDKSPGSGEDGVEHADLEASISVNRVQGDSPSEPNFGDIENIQSSLSFKNMKGSLSRGKSSY